MKIMGRIVRFVLGFAGMLSVALAASPASALTFNISTYNATGVTAATTSELAAITAAAAAWSAAFTDPFTVTLQVGFASLQPGALAGTSPTEVNASTSSVMAQMRADEKDQTDVAAYNSLATLAPTGNVTLTTANARALGYTINGQGSIPDAIIEFSSTTDFATRNASGGLDDPNSYDLLGIAEHEIGHALGFVSDVPTSAGTYTPTLLDLFRFSSASTRATTAANSYYSLDDGTTDLAAFSPGPGDTYQASHWQEGTVSGGNTALMDPALAAGATQNLTPLDLQAFDAIGYDLAVPEPASMLLLAGGVLAAGVLRRRQPRDRDQAAR
jgi:hypothetical protein